MQEFKNYHEVLRVILILPLLWEMTCFTLNFIQMKHLGVAGDVSVCWQYRSKQGLPVSRSGSSGDRQTKGVKNLVKVPSGGFVLRILDSAQQGCVCMVCNGWGAWWHLWSTVTRRVSLDSLLLLPETLIPCQVNQIKPHKGLSSLGKGWVCAGQLPQLSLYLPVLLPLGVSDRAWQAAQVPCRLSQPS